MRKFQAELPRNFYNVWEDRTVLMENPCAAVYWLSGVLEILSRAPFFRFFPFNTHAEILPHLYKQNYTMCIPALRLYYLVSMNKFKAQIILKIENSGRTQEHRSTLVKKLVSIKFSSNCHVSCQLISYRLF